MPGSLGLGAARRDRLGSLGILRILLDELADVRTPHPSVAGRQPPGRQEPEPYPPSDRGATNAQLAGCLAGRHELVILHSIYARTPRLQQVYGLHALLDLIQLHAMDEEDRERIALLEARVERQRRGFESELDRLAKDVRELRERVEIQLAALDRRIARLERQ